MIIQAKQSTTWITPRKLRSVADAIRGKDLAEVNLILSSLNKRGAQVINETIRQAVANAVNNLGLPEETLTLKTLMINEGPKFRRFRAGARGQAKPYAQRTSHVIVELESPDAQAPVAKTATKAKAQAKAKPEAKSSATKSEAKADAQDTQSATKKTAPKKAAVTKETKPSAAKATTAKKTATKAPAAKKTTKKSTKKEAEK